MVDFLLFKHKFVSTTSQHTVTTVLRNTYFANNTDVVILQIYWCSYFANILKSLTPPAYMCARALAISVCERHWESSKYVIFSSTYVFFPLSCHFAFCASRHFRRKKKLLLNDWKREVRWLLLRRTLRGYVDNMKRSKCASECRHWHSSGSSPSAAKDWCESNAGILVTVTGPRNDKSLILLCERTEDQAEDTYTHTYLYMYTNIHVYACTHLNFTRSKWCFHWKMMKFFLNILVLLV
jgi:hypothetical protein